MIAQATRSTGGVLDVEFPAEPKFDYLPEVTKDQGPYAFLTIQEGCDKFCHFCCVPYTRGAEFSRPVADIEQEAKQLVTKGSKEIILLGQNVNAYHGQGTSESDEWGLGKLMTHLSIIDGLRRLRYSTSHPHDVDDELISAHRDIPQVMPYVHLPVQSGSDQILKAMNRKHTADDYRRIIEKFKNARSDIAFSSDFIVGYPGETDADFEDTVKLVKDIKFALAYSFKYSPRPGTPAAALESQVPEALKAERLEYLQGILRQQQLEFNQGLVGTEQEVLLTQTGRLEGQLVGHSVYQQLVHIKAPTSLLGKIVKVKITAAGLKSLAGTHVSY